ncbi:MAG: ABC transporter ATP-binding protein [bacterium JZ-2024 1]
MREGGLPLMVLERVNKVYRENALAIPALTDFHLVIEKGDMLALMGPSGSGKTTLLNLMGALDSPTSGRILFQGKDIAQVSLQERAEYRRRYVGFIFQSHNLIPVLTAKENVLLSFWIRGGKTGDSVKQVDELFRILGLVGLENRRPAELSGGQQQRVAVARALAGNPSLLLADEPTANLDSVNASLLMQWLKDVNHRLGVTVIYSTHDPSIAHYARKIAHLRDGRLHSLEIL